MLLPSLSHSSQLCVPASYNHWLASQSETPGWQAPRLYNIMNWLNQEGVEKRIDIGTRMASQLLAASSRVRVSVVCVSVVCVVVAF